MKVAKKVDAISGESVSQACWGGWHGLAVNSEGKLYAWRAAPAPAPTPVPGPPTRPPTPARPPLASSASALHATQYFSLNLFVQGRQRELSVRVRRRRARELHRRSPANPSGAHCPQGTDTVAADRALKISRRLLAPIASRQKAPPLLRHHALTAGGLPRFGSA